MVNVSLSYSLTNIVWWNVNIEQVLCEVSIRHQTPCSEKSDSVLCVLSYKPSLPNITVYDDGGKGHVVDKQSSSSSGQRAAGGWPGHHELPAGAGHQPPGHQLRHPHRGGGCHLRAAGGQLLQVHSLPCQVGGVNIYSWTFDCMEWLTYLRSPSKS